MMVKTVVPTAYYVIIPRGGFAEFDQILGTKTSKFTIPQRKAVKEYLATNGTFTDDNQFEADKSRDFRYWTLDGQPRVIVEAEA